MTALVHRYRSAALLFGIIILLLIAAYWAAHQPEVLRVNGKQFVTEMATNDVAREQGLSGRSSLASNAAMVFVFDAPAQQCFWMKDMRFSIDIVWLDSNRKVTAIERSVSPDSYPMNYCHDGQYVIEFADGGARRAELGLGDTVDF